MNKFYILFLLVYTSCSQQNQDQRIKPSVTNITESVYASVTVRPEVTYFPQPISSGVIQEIFVEEGDIVQKGQILFQISKTASATNRLTNAELSLKEMEANYLGKDNLLLNIEAELQSVKQQLLLDSINLKGQERLWTQNIGKRIDLDKAKLAYQSTLSNFQILQKKYSQTLTNLESNYKKSLSQLKAERSLLADLAVRSEMDGKVYTINKEEGELISSQEKFAEIGSATSFIIEMDIDEVDITKIEIGDTVTIILDAYPDEVFIARTNKISPKKDEATQTFRVESLFEQRPSKLYNGLSGEANIIVANRENVMVIPSDYLMYGNKVLTSNGEKNVKTGVKNMQFTEIVSGIDTTTFLIKPNQ